MARITTCFHWDESRGTLDVALSERDLVSLLTLLYTPGAPKSLVTRNAPAEFAHCRIVAEFDQQHYAHSCREGAQPASVNPMDSVIERTIDEVLQEQLRRTGQRHRADWIEGQS